MSYVRKMQMLECVIWVGKVKPLKNTEAMNLAKNKYSNQGL